MQVLKIPSALLILVALFSCGRAGQGEMDYKAVADTTAAIVSSSAAVENGKDTTRRFIRTADLKFMVKSVVKSTYDIENITSRQGGFVTFTNLTSEIDQVSSIPVSADTSLETKYYIVTNYITLRVPNTKLDTTLKEIAQNIDYLDFRIIKADDVALQILSNDLALKRSAQSQTRLTNAIDNRGKKLNETAVAEETLLSKHEQADNAKLSNLSLSDQVKFSTINLSIYQRQTIKRELISNDKNIEAYEPGFGSKMLESLKFGWNMLELCILFIARLWAVVLLTIFGYFLYKKYSHKLK